MVKKSTMVNNFITVLNIGIVLFVIIAGAINTDISNWRINPVNDLLFQAGCQHSPFPFVVNQIGLTFAKWTVAVGGIIGIVASLFGAMFPQPRIIYPIAQDGLVFRALGDVSHGLKIPVFGTLCAAVLIGTMAGLFDLKAVD